MNKVFFKTPTALIAGIALLSTTACTDRNEPTSTGDVGADGTVQFAFRGVPYKDSSEEDTDMLSQVNVYHFKGEDFFLRTDIDDPYAEVIGLPTNGTTKIYCVSKIDLNPEMGMKEEAFLNSTVTCKAGDEKAPMFYSGAIDFSEENLSNGRLEIEMKRGVARIDFVNTVDPDIIINKVIVEDAPASTFVFPCNSMPDEATVSFSREFAEPFQGVETGMFQIFESTRPVNVRVLGEYGDTPVNILTSIPSIERNKVYTLQITNINSNVTGAITVKEWQEGSATGAIPSTTKGIFIDQLNSVVPEGVEVDYGNNTVTVPFEGANNIKLAFLAKTKVSISSIEGEISTAKVSPNEPMKIDEGYISSFNLSVEPNKRLAYFLVINIKDEEGRHNFVEVNVAVNPTRTIETVEIAGRTWMAFNAMSSDPNVQVFPIDGMTIEEMYQQNWATAIGNFFQYGKIKGYSPWTRNDPNGNSEITRNAPWGDPEAMPVPEGYHVATQADWLSLIPNGTQLPSTYTAGNGEEIKAELITLPGTLTNSPSAQANKAGLLMRYMRFESLMTGNVLIIPICGMKTNSWDEYPGGGRALSAWVGYWIYEDRCLWLLQVGGTNEEPAVTSGLSRWNYDGFMAVRGVKNLD
ncbi:MAG: fibrobacter succinogenes major paralogous domain-containing protein [Muribaculaceae bacterium]|nr:fibrobacter succinogenes major paralogous domain-containing protein [Muribaculaceae bacterium]